MPAKIEYQHGYKFPNTRLTYLNEVPKQNIKRRRALFECDCGKQLEIDIAWVAHLNTTSCGCYRSELVTTKNTKHSNAIRNKQSGAYRSWQAMHQRCNGGDPHYVNISICSHWSGQNGFENFLNDMGPRPKNYTIERINSFKDYEPSNCIWATRLTQANNSSNVKNVTINGITNSINQWCRIYGIGYHLVKQRVRRGISLEDAITIPPDTSKQNR